MEFSRDYALGAVWALMLGASMLYWPVRPSDRKALLRLWAVKILVTLGAMLFYERRYGRGDDYIAIAGLTDFAGTGFHFGDGWGNMLQLARLHLKLIPDSYHAAKTSVSLLGLLGVYLFYRAAALLRAREDERLLYFLALFPSILFWSSTLGKDPLCLLFMGVYAYELAAFYCRRKYLHLWLASAAVLAASYLRVWLGPVMIAPMILLIIRSAAGLLAKSALILALACFGALCVFNSGEKNLSLWRQVRAEAIGSVEGGRSSRKAPRIDSPADILRQLPAGAFTALFRPLPGDVPGALGLLAGLENAFLLALLAAALIRGRWVDLKEPPALGALILLAAWSGSYGLAVYNFGAMARYKLQILPVLLCLLLYFIRPTSAPTAAP